MDVKKLKKEIAKATREGSTDAKLKKLNDTITMPGRTPEEIVELMNFLSDEIKRKEDFVVSKIGRKKADELVAKYGTSIYSYLHVVYSHTKKELKHAKLITTEKSMLDDAAKLEKEYGLRVATDEHFKAKEPVSIKDIFDSFGKEDVDKNT